MRGRSRGVVGRRVARLLEEFEGHQRFASAKGELAPAGQGFGAIRLQGEGAVEGKRRFAFPTQR